MNRDYQVLNTSVMLPKEICCAKKPRKVGEQSSALGWAGFSSPLHLKNIIELMVRAWAFPSAPL